PTTLPDGTTVRGGWSPYQQKRRLVRRSLEGARLSEVMTYSLTTEENARGFATDKEQKLIQVSLPMSEEHSTMRTSLVPHLLDVIKYNINRKNNDVHIYEVGSVFIADEVPLKAQPLEKEMVAGALTGLAVDHLWQMEKKAVDFF